MITGYFLFGLKFAGFIIQPFNSTPSLVLKLNSSLLGIFRRETWCFNVLLSTKVANSLPLLSLRVMTGGVLTFCSDDASCSGAELAAAVVLPVEAVLFG